LQFEAVVRVMDDIADNYNIPATTETLNEFVDSILRHEK